jgi:hypothetical protein
MTSTLTLTRTTKNRGSELIEQAERRASTMTTLAAVAIGTGAMAVSTLAIGLGLIGLS